MLVVVTASAAVAAVCVYMCGRLLTPSQLSGVGVEHMPVPLVVTHAVHQQQLCRCSGFFRCSLPILSLSFCFCSWVLSEFYHPLVRSTPVSPCTVAASALQRGATGGGHTTTEPACHASQAPPAASQAAGHLLLPRRHLLPVCELHSVTLSSSAQRRVVVCSPCPVGRAGLWRPLQAECRLSAVGLCTERCSLCVINKAGNKGHECVRAWCWVGRGRPHPRACCQVCIMCVCVLRSSFFCRGLVVRHLPGLHNPMKLCTGCAGALGVFAGAQHSLGSAPPVYHHRCIEAASPPCWWGQGAPYFINQQVSGK